MSLLTTDSLLKLLDNTKEQIRDSLKAKIGEIENKVLIESVIQKQNVLKKLII